MAPAARLHLCSVPTSEVLALTAELASLGGGGNVALGRCWAGTVTPDSSAGTSLDARCTTAHGLHDELHQELWPWLHRGYSATVLLLNASSSSNAGSAGGECPTHLEGWRVLALLADAALHSGWQLGLSWQLVSNDAVRGPMGQSLHPAAAPTSRKRPQAAPAQRPGSRLGGRDATPEPAEPAGQRCNTMHAATTDELAQLLAVVQQQVEQLSAAGNSGHPPPALVLRLELQGPAGQPSPVLHVLQVAADSTGSAPSSGPTSKQQTQEQQHAGGSLWGPLLRLAEEVADLHRRRREGEHLLAAAKLSPLNQLAAPFLAGSTRLFVVASLPSSSSSSSSNGADERQLASLLSALQQVQCVCTKLNSPAVGPSASLGWLPSGQFLHQLEQQEQAGRQRRAEAAALAAAEADRKERLRAAAKERQQQQQQQGTAESSAQQAAAPVSEQQQQQHKQDEQQQPAQLSQQQPPPQAEQAATSYQAAAYGSPNAKQSARNAQQQRHDYVEEKQEQHQLVANTSARAPVQVEHAATARAASARAQSAADQMLASGSQAGEGSSLQQLRREFQSLYAAVAAPQQMHAYTPADVPAGGATAAAGTVLGTPPASCASGQLRLQAGSSNPGSPQLRILQQQQQPWQRHQTIAAGVAAADDISTHVAVLRMQAATEARHALLAQHEIFDSLPAVSADSPAAASGFAAAGDAAEAAFSWSGYSGDSSVSRPGSSGGGGGLGQQLAAQLLQHQRQAAVLMADSTPAKSLADLAGEAPSLGALFRAPTNRMDASTGRQAASWGRFAEEGAQHAQHEQHSQTSHRHHPEQDLHRQQQHHPQEQGPQQQPPQQPQSQQPGQHWVAASADSGWQASAALAESGSHPLCPSAGQSEATRGTEVSDIFQSQHMPLFTPPSAAARRGTAESCLRPASASTRRDWWEASSGSTGNSAGATSEQQEQEPLPASSGSYAAALPRRYASGSHPAAAQAAAEWDSLGRGATSRGSTGRPVSLTSQQQQDSSSQLFADARVAAAATTSEQDEAAGAACLLQELQREQRVNAMLLQQLHEVQQALEEAVVAAAALQQPMAPGVDDPADFNGLLAALQRERQRHMGLQRQLLLQQQQAEEQALSLEAQLHTQHRQLLISQARCRAWEQQSPMAALFQRYESDLQRVQAAAARMEDENCQLAALLAEADLEQLEGLALQSGNESAAAVSRQHQRKLQQAHAQIRKLQEQQAATLKELQAAQRRDRLAELCRRQAESGQRAAAELRQQLAARERQLEAQCLAAAESAAEATRLRDHLRQSELELGRALTDKADLSDAVVSLRQQVSLLRAQGSRDRILKRLQPPLG